MIQIYSPGNTDYEKNGDITLTPILCELEAELNGAWVLTLTVPVDDEGRFSYVKTGAVITAPTWMSNTQLFRIYNTVASDTEVTAYARPVFFDAADEMFLMDKRPTGKNGQEALNELLARQTRFRGKSDITKTSTAYYVRKNLIEALQSDDENAFLNRWGGEVSYDNYEISINRRVGADKGMRVELGYNCSGLESDISADEVVTRIIPVAYNGHLLPGDKPWVDSPLINHYAVVKTKEIKFDDVKLKADAQEDEESFETLEAVCAELKKRCQEQFEQGIDKPVCNYKCDMVDLARTDAYADLQGLVQVALGDTVHCKNKVLEIETEARVIKVTYDCIQKANTAVELGAFSYNYFNELSSTINRVDSAIDRNGNVMGGKINGIIDGMTASLRVQNTASKRSDAKAILFEDLDESSPLYGAMCIGTQGFQIAKERTEDGSDWKWTTFGTANGFIADYIIAGIIASKNEEFVFNLGTGDIWANDMYASLLRTDRVEAGSGVLEHTRIEKDIISMYQWFAEEGPVGVMGRNRCFSTQPAWYKDDAGEITDFGAVINAGGRLSEIPRIELMRPSGKMKLYAKELLVGNTEGNGKKALTGRAELSDGTYLEFRHGILIGGKTAEGGTIK